jgi:hypothetical protein
MSVGDKLDRIEARIAAAFADGAKSTDVSALIAEVEGRCVCI